jgi:DNA-binding SARP family transcriptional activator
MLEASHIMAENGKELPALWMAKRAYQADSNKEEVYRALMGAQIKAGRRTSAMQTYFACKNFLSEELGVLPSQLTTNLYQKILMDNS